MKAVDKVLNDIQRPFTAIMGGSKVSSKIEIIENLLNKVDNLIITGGMTYTFTKAQGGKIGLSICEDDKLDLALELLKKAKEKGVNLVLAVDAKIADSFSNDANTQFCKVNEIPDGWEGLDIGPETERFCRSYQELQDYPLEREDEIDEEKERLQDEVRQKLQDRCTTGHIMTIGFEIV